MALQEPGEEGQLQWAVPLERPGAVISLFVVCTIARISLQTLHCFHAVPAVQGRHNTLQDLGIPCRPAHGTALVCRVTFGPSCTSRCRQGLGNALGIVLTPGWGSNSSAPDAASDEKQPFPLPNFLILALYLEALYCWLPW